MVSNKFGLTESVIEKVNRIFAGFSEIKKVLIYGSRAKGNYKKGSDIDLTLIGEKLDLRTVHKIELEIDDLLLPYTFDISIYDHIENEDLLDHMNRVGKVFYVPDIVTHS